MAVAIWRTCVDLMSGVDGRRRLHRIAGRCIGGISGANMSDGAFVLPCLRILGDGVYGC
jgi:hypothetical protein